MQNNKGKYRHIIILNKRRKLSLSEISLSENSPIGKDGQCFNDVCLIFIQSSPFKLKTVNINIKDLVNQSEEILHDLLSIVFFLSFIYCI